jgi:amidase
MLDFMARHSPCDSFIPIVPPAASYLRSIERDPARQRIALSTGAWGRKRCDPETAAAVRRYADKLSDLGHDVVEVADDDINDWEQFWVVFLRGASWLGGLPYGEMLQEMGGVPSAESLSYQLAASVELSRHITAAEVREHAMVNQHFNRRVAAFFDHHDLLLSPTNAIPPPIAGGRYSVMNEMDGQQWIEELFDAVPYTPLANEVGIPGISVPVGLSERGLPIGAHLYAPWLREDLLLSMAAQTERCVPEWFDMRPPLHVSTI